MTEQQLKWKALLIDEAKLCATYYASGRFTVEEMLPYFLRAARSIKWDSQEAAKTITSILKGEEVTHAA